MSDKETWKEPKTEKIHLWDGSVVEGEVNGLSDNRRSGFVFANGREINVILVDGVWTEDPDYNSLP